MTAGEIAKLKAENELLQGLLVECLRYVMDVNPSSKKAIQAKEAMFNKLSAQLSANP